ncbi:uncharacterized protein CANTADRAFT_47580 [Suhomyces tanzawaensis NRRL Y-17324]|uniref:Uncharacterized protein n=1 Tax=Suhomyces tanzawaensis NRRL Y-17324 TaxID=984487 RepID=A0A1E4SLU1_9ASCO|nr:uncharacterized protein CANTADRAFT_47580 [Suhomyces tanzawaensis NRRL Y-17324]ODV80494.1 hypothetical protein CANTADRAFT_47580 [Suhomyces tanzawaensis NRRL Y-17324]
MSNPQEQIYIEYLNYDWDSFSEFQEGLNQILDGYLENLKEQDPSVRSIPPLDKQQLIDQAKSFFYCSHTDNILNLDDYQQWKLVNGDKYAKNKKITEVRDEDETKPKELTQAATTEDPPYSSNYQDLVELIVSGKPVPGIKDIPDTVLTEKSSVSEAKQRTKPWEK